MVGSAFLAVLAWVFVSALLHWGYQSIPAVETVLSLFFGFPMKLLTNFGVGFSIGALALYLFEKSAKRLTIPQLWFLVLFTAIGMCLYDYSPIAVYRLLTVKFNLVMLIGFVLGIFLCGKKHWR